MERTWALDDAQRERLVELRRQLHRRPELGFEEHETAALVRGRLEALGLSPEVVAGTGVVAVVEGPRPGRTLLLRADLDGLPVQEENVHAYASEIPGRMHACGHDGHTAMLLFAAERLTAACARLAGRVVLCFQPAEEARGGAARVIAGGLLERFGVERCAGLHLWSELPTGAVAATPGPFMASGDIFRVTVHGRGGHAALPHAARDPLVAAAQMVVALQTVVAREVPPEEPAVLTVGTLQAGQAPNVIPDSAAFAGTTRAFSRAVQRQLEAAVRRVVAGVAAAAGVSAEVDWTEVALPVVNDAACAAAASEIVAAHPRLTAAPPGWRTMASEDMSYFLAARPGIFVFLGARNPAVGASYPHHHPRFEIDEAALPLGVELLCHLAERLAAP
jgi:amidohydrolase